MSNIPEDLVMDVLSRLWVKLLLRFRSVSKSWRTLIDSPSFIKIHMERSMKMKMAQSTVEVIHRCNRNKFYLLHLDLSRDPHPIRDPEELPHPFGHRYTSVAFKGLYQIRLVGSCNGLLCFVDCADCIVLWNLATRKYFQLQYLGIELPKSAIRDHYVNYGFGIELPKSAIRDHYVNYGFGYDSATDDYKVIRSITAFHNNLSVCTLVELYSLKSDSWTRLGDFMGFDFGVDYGILVGGALYWIRYQRDIGSIIVAFDLTKEEFNFVPRPDLSGNFTLTNLGNYQGCLSLFFRSNEKADPSIVWVMKELGVKDSWTKVFSVDNTYSYMRNIDHSKSKSPTLSLWVKNKETLEWYNKEKKTLENIKIYCEKGYLEAEFVHCESLVGTSWFS
ncbi:F-box protein CPR30 [Abeliophyllum distichum]|uniref:F-box protein CPR30 n=1 Tax=Abeliophyllum distichum TaxID=126358 RepID=A0ABD1V8K0_9LAMI